MIMAVYFCCQKQGFHEDEYYSYYSTSRTFGLFVEDGTWTGHDAYYNEFVVLEGEGFQYGLVKLVQSWDVHPPVYYWILHTICSLFPGKFSKWFGLIINLAAFGVGMFLLRVLALQLTKHNEKLSFLICFFYGFTPAVMSSVVFIRMYALLTVFVYLCAILHIHELEADRGKLSFWKFLLPLSVVTYLGFLTQYYYFIFLFFMAAAFCVYLLWQGRSLWNCFRYGLSLAAAFILAYLTYPSCLGQMFRGQRGAQATDNFFDLSNTWTRLLFFGELLDEYVFGKMLPIVLILILLLLLYAAASQRGDSRGRNFPKKNFRRNYGAYWLLLFAVSGYFLVVSKTALLLGNTSVRYQEPIYGLAVLLIFMTIERLGEIAGKGMINRKRENLLVAAAAIICLLVNVAALFFGRVVFLYPEDAGRVAFAKERAAQDTPVIYLYDAGQSWCVWDSADEFFEYDRIYFANQHDTEPIADAVIAGSGDLVVYLSNTSKTEEQLRRIMDSNPGLTAYELQYQEKYCDVYYFYGET